MNDVVNLLVDYQNQLRDDRSKALVAHASTDKYDKKIDRIDYAMLLVDKHFA